MKINESRDVQANDAPDSVQSKRDKRNVSMVRRIVLRIVFALIVAGIAYVVLTSNKKPDGATIGSSREPSHHKLDYFSFVDGDSWGWTLSENTKVAMKLSRVYPQGHKIKFRFEGKVSLDEKIMPIEVVLAAVPKITNGEVRVGEVQLESCDLNDEAVANKKDFKDLPRVLLALMKGDVKFVGVPLYGNATEIISMTTAEMLVK